LDANMQTRILARATMPSNKIIQHSHSPCITPHYVVSKLDSFTARSPLNKNSGLLKFVRQGEDSLWFVMNRQTKETRLMRGDTNFVNNHFWNCYEEVTDASTGAVDVVVEAVAATEDYLDTYVIGFLALASSPVKWKGGRVWQSIDTVYSSTFTLTLRPGSLISPPLPSPSLPSSSLPPSPSLSFARPPHPTPPALSATFSGTWPWITRTGATSSTPPYDAVSLPPETTSPVGPSWPTPRQTPRTQPPRGLL
jgi:hypothetical protein